jgi:hypothetical protein
VDTAAGAAAAQHAASVLLMLVAGMVAASLALNAAIVLSFLRYVRGIQRQYARREDALIDKVCHLAGKPWNEAPAGVVEEEEPEPDRYVSAPEQYADAWG